MANVTVKKQCALQTINMKGSNKPKHNEMITASIPKNILNYN